MFDDNMMTCLKDTEYKMESAEHDPLLFKYNHTLILNKNKICNNRSCQIFVRNDGLFGMTDYIKIQDINVDNMKIKWIQGVKNDFKLKDRIIVLDSLHIDAKYYQAIFDCKFVLLFEKVTSSQIPFKEVLNGNKNYIYQFNDINEIYFILPLSVQIKKYYAVKIYAQFKEGYDFVYLQTLTRMTGNIHRIDAILITLCCLKCNIKHPSELWNKMQCSITNRDLSLMEVNPLLYEPLVHDPSKLVLHRLIEELHCEQLQIQYKALTTQLNIHFYSAFKCFSAHANIMHQYQRRYSHLLDNEYKIIRVRSRNSFGEETKSKDNDDICFKYGQTIMIRDSIATLTETWYKVFIQNKGLFNVDTYFHLQDIKFNLWYHKRLHNHKDFAYCLELEGNKLISFNEHDLDQKFDEEVLSAQFVLICNENTNKQQINQQEIFCKNYIYKFDTIEDIHFIVPFKFNLKKVSLYAQVESNCNFVLVKTFNIKDSDIKKNNRKTQIDYLLKLLKIYKFNITNPKTFYDQIGISLTDNDVPIIKRNEILYKISKSNEIILHRLVFELKVTKIHDLYLNKRSENIFGFLRQDEQKQTTIQNNRFEMMTKKKKVVLLLGSANSGKSTVFKQLRMIYGKGFDINEKNMVAAMIYEQCINDMKLALTSLTKYQNKTLYIKGLEYVTEELKKYEILTLSKAGLKAQTYLNNNYSLKFNKDIVAALKCLWQESAIQKMYQMRNITKINDSTAYFWDKLDLLCSIDYVPTDLDMIYLSCHTSAVIKKEYVLSDKQSFISIIDAGGRSVNRKKWSDSFIGITAIIFVASVSCYDEVLYEVDNVSFNAMTDQLKLFDYICNIRRLHDIPKILLLNKKDLLQDKIKRVPLQICGSFKNFTGDSRSYKQCIEYIEERFVLLNKTRQNILAYRTCAVDKGDIKQVLTDVLGA